MNSDKCRELLIEFEKYLNNAIEARNNVQDSYGKIEGETFMLVKQHLEELKMKYA